MRLLPRAWIVACSLAAPGALAEPLDDSAPPSDNDRPVLQARVRARRAPSSAAVTVIETDVLRAAPRRTATDLLRLVPGVVAAQHGGDGKAHQLFLRGFDAVHGQDVEVVVGGVRVNEVSHVHALGYADTNFVIPEAVRALRLDEGAGLAEQGDFAVAGTLTFDLGLDAPGFTGTMETGPFDQVRTFAGFRPEGDDRSFVALQATRGAGFGPRRGFERVNALAQAGFGDGAFDLRLLGGASVSRFESAGVVRASEVVSDGLFAATDAWQGGASSRLFALAEAGVRGEGAGTTATLSVQRTTFENRQDFTGFLRDSIHGDGLSQAQSTLQSRLDVIHRRRLDLLDRPLRLQLGLGMRGDSLDQSQVPYDDATGVLRDDARLRDWHVDQLDAFSFAEGEWKLERLQIRLGARLDLLAVHAKSPGPGPARDVTSIGPHLGLKGGLSVPLPDDWLASLDYGEGFRSPLAAALADGQVTPFTRIRTLDLGARHEGTRETLAGTAFASLVDDDVFFDHLVARTAYVGPTARAGLGLRGAWRFESVVVAAHGTAANAVLVRDGSRLPGFAPLVGRLDASWRPVLGNGPESSVLQLGLGTTAVGPRPLRDGTWGEGYVLVDARFSVRWRRLELALDVTNLLDARWFDGTFSFPSHFDQTRPQSALPARHVTAGAPRQAFVSVSFVPGEHP